MSKTSVKPEFKDLFFSRTYEFLHIYLTKQVGKSPNTVEAYTEGLKRFFDFLVNVKKVSPMKFTFADCTHALVLEFVEYLRDTLHHSSSTVNSRISAIRSYLGYVSDNNIELTSIYLSICRIPTLSVPKPVRPIIEPSELNSYLDMPENTRIGNRDRFILILLFDSAVRVSELTGIRLGDIAKRDNYYVISIHGKGRKERLVYLSDKASAHMDGYLSVYHEGLSDPSRPLIYTKSHGQINPMSARNVERITEKYGKLAKEKCPDIPDRVHPHMLRRTRGTTMYRDGIPLEQISALLGHSFIETTRSHYASPSPEQLRKSINSAIGAEPDENKEWLDHIDDMKKKFGL